MLLTRSVDNSEVARTLPATAAALAAIYQSSDDEIAAMRTFNRFNTRQMGLLDKNLLKSAFSLAGSRVIYELARQLSLGLYNASTIYLT